MFQDIQVSEDLNGKFLEYLKTDSTVQNPTVTNYLGLDLNIFVLQVKSLKSLLDNSPPPSRIIPGQ